ncbi:MICOS complex subunit [Crotalus adamanteus]|uniref:MICOS complex subunit n=1 Tax=Crotalus adamanteus TaxID=8729 RepID=A0AAW1BEL3_CROAD
MPRASSPVRAASRPFALRREALASPRCIPGVVVLPRKVSSLRAGEKKSFRSALCGAGCRHGQPLLQPTGARRPGAAGQWRSPVGGARVSLGPVPRPSQFDPALGAMGGGESVPRRVTFEADENDNITVVKGIRLSENVIERMKEPSSPDGRSQKKFGPGNHTSIAGAAERS